MRYSDIVAAVSGTIWAIRPSVLQALLDCDLVAKAAEIAAAKRVVQTKPVNGPVAIIPVRGVIDQHQSMLSDWLGWSTSEGIAAAVDAAVADPSVGAVVLDVDSPGGSVYGVQEAADRIYAARGTKRIIAVANSEAHSAAYWLASAADEVIVTPSGQVGSVGVYAMHVDTSKADEAEGYKVTIVQAGQYKTEGNPYEPLGDDARAEIQRQVDSYYGDFLSAVARNRGISKAKAQERTGEGRTFRAQEAVERGLATSSGSLQQVISDLQGRQKGRAKAAAMAMTIDVLEKQLDSGVTMA